jgi:hypothetical protein
MIAPILGARLTCLRREPRRYDRFGHRHGANAITGFIEALDAHGCAC